MPVSFLEAFEQGCFTLSLQRIGLGHPKNCPSQDRGNVELLLEGTESSVGPSGIFKTPGPGVPPSVG